MFGPDFLVSLRVGEDLVYGGLSLAALGLPAVGCQLNQEIVEIVGVVVDGGAAVVLLGSQFSTVQYVNTQVNVGD